MKHRGKIIFWASLLIIGAACVGASYRKREAAERQYSQQVSLARAEAQRIRAHVVLFTRRAVPSRIPFSAFLQTMGLGSAVAAQLVVSAQPVFDLRHLRAGNMLEVGRSTVGELREVRYRIDTDHMLSIEPSGSSFSSEIKSIPSETEEDGIAGEVQGSLFQAVTDAGEKPELAMRFAAIFAWDMDFYTDPRPGDTFRVVVEKKKFAAGETADYERILAAEYNNGGRTYRAVLFHDPSGNPAYYTPEGKSMKKAFLHSPLKFAAPITSHFSASRFHPILKVYRPHLGTDFGAPMGTPVQTIGDGRVIFAGMKGGDGNLVKVQHSNGYTTYYMHLSRILVRNGQRVEQGDRIGLVGMTGLATGPHLDFRIEIRGQFVNFERLPLPPSDPVAKADWSEFAAGRDHAMGEMPQIGAPLQSAVAKSGAKTGASQTHAGD